MAGVLEKRVPRLLRDGKGDLPGRGEDLRIVNDQLVAYRVGVHTRDAFNETKGVARRRGIATVSPDTRRVIYEVRSLDDQRVALPMAARVSEVAPDALSDMRPLVQGNDACLVDLLVENRHESGRLHNLRSVVIARRKYRAREAARDAADV